MTDRELLEKAAKAAEYEVLSDWINFTVRKNEVDSYPYAWNPLTDDGDALRLAVKLHFSVLSNETASWIAHGIGQINIAEEYHDGKNPYAATRRAIVRAAAAIGETL